MKKNAVNTLSAVCFVLFGLSVSLASSTVTPVGPSSLNGVPTTVDAMTDAKNNIKGTSKVWIGTTDNLPHRMESDIELPVTKVGGHSFGGKSHLVMVWAYNLKLEINAPI
jgi:hypothetical protein